MIGIHHFAPEWNIWTTIGIFAAEHINDYLTINPTDFFIVPLAFPLVLAADWHFYFLVKSVDNY